MDNYNQQQFNSYTVVDSHQTGEAGTVTKKFMANVFAWMFLALGISAVCALMFSMNDALRAQLYTETVRGVSLTGTGMLVAIAPLAFVLIMSFGFNRLSVGALTGVFLCYAAVMGMSLSVILLAYTSGSVIGCFTASSAMFGVMAVLGYTTDKDLTSFGSILMMGLIGIIIASMINWFLQSDGLYYLISILGVAIFTGLTAYDVQKLKRIGAGIEYQGMGVAVSDTRKIALMGALSLYLDFINLFLMMLRLFGRRK